MGCGERVRPGLHVRVDRVQDAIRGEQVVLTDPRRAADKDARFVRQDGDRLALQVQCALWYSVQRAPPRLELRCGTPYNVRGAAGPGLAWQV
jgi:hypothetical protein